MKLNNYYIVFIFLIICGLNQNCKKKIIQSEKEVTKDFILQEIKVADSSKEIKVMGSVSYFKKAEITSKVLGRIETYLKEEGDRVSKGDTLAKVETLNLQIQLQKDKATIEVQEKQKELAEAKLLLAKQRIERDLSNIEKAEADVKDAKAIMENLQRSGKNKKELHEIGGVSETELKSVETSLNSATLAFFKAQKNLSNLEVGYREVDLKNSFGEIPKDPKKKHNAFIDLNTAVEKAEVEMSKANLNATKMNIESTELLIRESNLKTPITGIVATRSKERGEAVKEGEPIYIIVDTSQVLIRYNVNESDVWKLEVGQKVKFTADAYPGKSYNGKIHLISPLVDPQSRTVEVKVISDNPKSELKPGMFSRGEIAFSRNERTFIIPQKSIVLDESKSSGYIFTANQTGLLFKKNVIVVKTIGEEYEVTGEMKEGDLIAVGNVASIQEGESGVLQDKKN